MSLEETLVPQAESTPVRGRPRRWLLALAIGVAAVVGILSGAGGVVISGRYVERSTYEAAVKDAKDARAELKVAQAKSAQLADELTTRTNELRRTSSDLAKMKAEARVSYRFPSGWDLGDTKVSKDAKGNFRVSADFTNEGELSPSGAAWTAEVMKGVNVIATAYVTTGAIAPGQQVTLLFTSEDDYVADIDKVVFNVYSYVGD